MTDPEHHKALATLHQRISELEDQLEVERARVKQLEQEPNAEDSMEGHVGPKRRKMPDERTGFNHKFEIGHERFEGYIITGQYSDGQLGEIFLQGIGKDGSTLYGISQAFAIMFSIALQYGAPVDMICRKLAHMKFEPRGPTTNPDIPECNSMIDYIARCIAGRYGDPDLLKELDRIREEMRVT